MMVKLRRGKKIRMQRCCDWKETKSVDETVGEIKMYLLTA